MAVVFVQLSSASTVYIGVCRSTGRHETFGSMIATHPSPRFRFPDDIKTIFLESVCFGTIRCYWSLPYSLTIMSSLVGSIFGSVEPSSGLLNIFEASSALPDRPQHKPLPRKKKQKKKVEERVETSDEAEPSKKKRKRNKDDQGEDNEDTERKDAGSKNDERNGESIENGESANEKEPPSADDRTIFVGNLPLDTTRNSLKSIFTKCGKVESTRLRSIATTGVKVAPEQKGNQALVKKVAVNTQNVDKDARSTAQGYVVFADKESVEKALLLNNSLVGIHLIRVDRVNPTIDASRSVFVGNLPYQTDEASLRQHFVLGCSLANEDIENVRIIRDKLTQQCKGFGYILFTTKTMATTALQRMHESIYKKRNLRVTVCGKRFKGRKGDPSEKEKTSKPVDAAGALKRILVKEAAGTKRKRGGDVKPSGPKVTTNNPKGLSRRQSSEAKLEKRHKKLQKRAAKGMGKTKKGF